MELFGREVPEPMVSEWWADRCERCRLRIWAVCRDLLAQQVDVVLDFGFPGRESRAQYRQLALESGAGVHVHVVTADAPVRWDRVRARNQQRGETFALEVTEGMFAASETWWEPPTEVEVAGTITFHGTETPRPG
jgi:predicted kinase